MQAYSRGRGGEQLCVSPAHLLQFCRRSYRWSEEHTCRLLVLSDSTLARSPTVLSNSMTIRLLSKLLKLWTDAEFIPRWVSFLESRCCEVWDAVVRRLWRVNETLSQSEFTWNDDAFCAEVLCPSLSGQLCFCPCSSTLVSKWSN